MARQEEKSGQIFDIKILRRIFSFTKPYRTKFWLLVTIILLLACVVPLSPLLIKHTIDNQIANGDYNGLALMVLAMVGLLIL
jgi:ATP-binding cassette, subfamily B, multidrug efflux pump